MHKPEEVGSWDIDDPVYRGIDRRVALLLVEHRLEIGKGIERGGLGGFLLGH